MTTRREFLFSAAAGAAVFYVNPLPAQSQSAASSQVVGLHWRRYGDVKVTSLLDGFIPIDPNQLNGAAPETVTELLKKAFLPGGPVETSINSYVIEAGGRTILVDGGVVAGPDGKPMFGETTGKLPAAFALAGFEPDAVDTLFCTHLHPDHIGFFFDGPGARFKNAELVLHQDERAFWNNDANFSGADEQVKAFAAAARAAMGAYEDRLKLVKDGDPVAPGLEAMHLPGHTPGHMGLLAGSADANLLIWGDIVHVGPCQFAQPNWTIGFDVDQPLAARTRKAVFALAVTDRLAVAGSHVDFPSFGHLEAAGEGVRFVPSRWDHQI